MSLAINLNEITTHAKLGQAQSLHAEYKKNLLTSYLSLINCAGDGLNENFSELIQTLKKIANLKPIYFSPWFFYLYFQLVCAIENDDVDAVKNNLNLFQTSHLNDFVMHAMEVQPGLQQSWECDSFENEVLVSFGHDEYQARSPNQNEFVDFKSDIDTALQLINAADPILANEIQSLVSCVRLVISSGVGSATSPKFFGVIYITKPDFAIDYDRRILSSIDHLVHEAAHLFLNLVLTHDPLVLNAEQDRFVSPLRSDLRPMLGIYHGAFVLNRVIGVFKKISHLNLFHNKEMLKQWLEKLEKEHRIAQATLRKNAKLTKLGGTILGI